MLVTKLKAIALLLLAAVLSVGGTTAAVSTVASAGVDAAPQNDWRQRFDAVYSLAPGEVMKFIPAPFIQERGEYVRNDQGLGNKAAGQAMAGSLVRHLADNGKPRFESFATSGGEDDTNLADVCEVCGLAAWEVDGERRILPLAGDFVVRWGATKDQKVSALQEILRRQLNRPALRIEKRQVEREVIVARGQLALAPEVVEADNDIYVAGGKRLGESGNGSGSLGAFLERLRDLTGRPVIVETPSGGQQVSWTIDASASKARDDRAELRTLLANVSRQTGLRLETQRRRLTVYALDEGQPVRK
jgi:hypothetical protein